MVEAHARPPESLRRASAAEPVCEPLPPITTSASMPRRCEVAQRLGAPGGSRELGAARAAEHRAAALDDAADVARRSGVDGVGEQPGVAVAHAEHLPALGQRAARDRAHRGVHAGRVAAARQDCNLFQAMRRF